MTLITRVNRNSSSMFYLGLRCKRSRCRDVSTSAFSARLSHTWWIYSSLYLHSPFFSSVVLYTDTSIAMDPRWLCLFGAATKAIAKKYRLPFRHELVVEEY